jgi:hypothetical protein
MKIKLSYPIKEVVNINGGFRDFNLASDGSIIADYGKPQRNEIYRLHARGKKFKKGIDILPFFPISIHVTNSGQILVSQYDIVIFRYCHSSWIKWLVSFLNSLSVKCPEKHCILFKRYESFSVL